MQCADCGAIYSANGDSCRARFDALLALDHSHQEPWGSRHGQAFAAYALQHPATFGPSLDGAWATLYQIYVAGNSATFVFEQLRSRRGALPREWNVPARPGRPVEHPTVTIADLAEFEAASYPLKLDAWCRAALAMWGA